MKLSDAIRKGCEMAPGQCSGVMFVLEGRQVLATCAIGAAVLADVGPAGIYEGEAKGHITWANVFQRFHLKSELAREIVKMNDGEGRTREEIADWLDQHGW